MLADAPPQEDSWFSPLVRLAELPVVAIEQVGTTARTVAVEVGETIRDEDSAITHGADTAAASVDAVSTSAAVVTLGSLALALTAAGVGIAVAVRVLK